MAVLFAFAILAAACGDDDDGASSTDGGETESGDGQTDDAGGDAAGGDNSRDGEVIKIGYVNNEGGALSLPEFRIGGEVAVDLINSQGGIDGAQIELVSCIADITPEAEIDCANKLIEEDVVMAYMGIALASEAALPLYNEAGIMYISSNSWGEGQKNNDGSYLTHSASGAFAVGPLVTFKELGAENVAVILEDNPAARTFFTDIIDPIAANVGVTIEAISVDPANPDWTAAVATAQAADVDAIWGQLTEPGCIGMVTATSAVGYDKPVFAGSCSQYIDVLGEAAVGTYNQSDLYFPDVKQYAPPEIADRLSEYEQLMTDSGNEQYINGFAVAPFSAWMQIRPFLQSIDGPITAESVQAAFDNAGTTPGWFGPDLNCGSAPWPAETSHCRAEIAVWQVENRDDGTVGRVLHTEFFNAFEASGL